MILPQSSRKCKDSGALSTAAYLYPVAGFTEALSLRYESSSKELQRFPISSSAASLTHECCSSLDDLCRN